MSEEKRSVVIEFSNEGTQVHGVYSLLDSLVISVAFLEGAEKEKPGVVEAFCKTWNDFIDECELKTSRLYTDKDVKEYKATIASLQEALLVKGGQV